MKIIEKTIKPYSYESKKFSKVIFVKKHDRRYHVKLTEDYRVFDMKEKDKNLAWLKDPELEKEVRKAIQGYKTEREKITKEDSKRYSYTSVHRPLGSWISNTIPREQIEEIKGKEVITNTLLSNEILSKLEIRPKESGYYGKPSYEEIIKKAGLESGYSEKDLEEYPMDAIKKYMLKDVWNALKKSDSWSNIYSYDEISPIIKMKIGEMGKKRDKERRYGSKKIVVGPIEISRSDLNYDTACNAYRNISWSPDKRADEEQNAYVESMIDMYKSLEPLAKNEKQKEVLREELIRYKNEYLSKRESLLHTRSGVASSAITGGSGFPVRQQEKRHDIEHRKTGEFLKWDKKVKNIIKRKINREVTDKEKFSSLEKQISKDIKMALTKTVVLKGKKEKVPAYIRTAAKARIEGRITTLIRNGEVEKIEKLLNIIGDTQKKMGKTTFTNRNKIWNASYKAGHVREREKEKKVVGTRQLSKFKGANIINNYEDERVQIFFDEKPSEEVRKDLRGEGWRWSPSIGVWQRKNTKAAEWSSERIVDRHFEKIN